MENNLNFWAFAAFASFGLLYANHQEFIDNKLIPDVKHITGIEEGRAVQNPPPRKKDIFDEHFKRAEFKPVPKSVTPVFIESKEDRELDKALGFDTSDPGYCTEDPCVVH